MNGKASKYLGKLAHHLYAQMDDPPGTIKSLKRHLKRNWTRLPHGERRRLYGND